MPKIRLIAKRVELTRDEDGKVILITPKYVTKDFEIDFEIEGNPFIDNDLKKFEIVSAEIIEDDEEL